MNSDFEIVILLVETEKSRRGFWVKYILRKIDFKILNLAVWSTLLIAYFSPIRYIRLVEVGMGFPFEFITTYDISQGIDPLDSMEIHWGYFLLNIILIYFLIYYINKFYKHIQDNRKQVVLKFVNVIRSTPDNRSKNDLLIDVTSSTDGVESVDIGIVCLDNNIVVENGKKS